MLHHFNAAPDVAFGVFKGFTVVFSKNTGQLVVVLFEQLLIAEHHPGALRHRDLAPLDKCLGGTGDGALNFIVTGHRYTSQQFLSRGVVNLKMLW